ncbi:MAG: DUF58 domain-containing protein [Bradymonadales bacterium]|jgi:hypothetical protein
MSNDLVVARKRAVDFGGVGFLLRRILGLFPLSIAGLVLLGLLAAVWFGEVSANANQILFALILCLGACIVLFFLFVAISAIWVGSVTWQKNRRQILAGEYDAEGEIWTGFKIFRPFFMPLVEFELAWYEPVGMKSRWEGRGMWLEEIIEPQSRGQYSSLVRSMRISDIFGLCVIQLYWKQDAQLIVKPAPALMGEFAIIDESSGDGYSHPKGAARGELVEMRRYQAGDPLRLVLWRVFARNRELLVRAPEIAIVEHKDLFVYFVAGKDDDASASLARDFLEKNTSQSDNFVFGADGAERLVHSPEEGMSDVIQSSEHRDKGGRDLLRLAQSLPNEILNNCYIMVPSTKGSWIKQISHFVAKLGVKPVFLLGLSQGFEQELRKRRGRFTKLLFNEPESGQRLKAFQEVYTKLESMGELRVFFPKTGEQLSRDEIEVLRKL